MTLTEHSPGADTGFVHLGVLPRDPDDLVATVLPEVRAARALGHHVVTVLDRRTGRRLHDALAPGGSSSPPESPDASVDALVPDEVHAGPPEDLVATVRRRVADGGRVLVLLQLPVTADPSELLRREHAFGRLFVGSPVTLVCAGPTDTRDLATVICDGHPLLVDRTGRRTNPSYFPAPGAGTPDPSGTRPVGPLRTAVRSPADLRGLREGVARMADGLGLGADETEAAVLAVHEAAMLATGGDQADRAGRGGRDGDHGGTAACVVEVRADGRGLRTEVTGPADGPEPCLRVLRLFAADAQVHDDVHDGRSVRAVTVRTDPA